MRVLIISILAVAIFIALFFATAKGASAQTDSLRRERFNIIAGVGFPQFGYIGATYQAGTFQFGVSTSYIPPSWRDGDQLNIVSGFVKWHLLGESKFSSRKPWYLKADFNYIRTVYFRPAFSDKYSSSYAYYARNNYTFAGFSIGRDFNISKKFGFNLDIGVTQTISHTVLRGRPGTHMLWHSYMWRPMYPAISGGMFFRI